jgi:hypothetical protein
MKKIINSRKHANVSPTLKLNTITSIQDWYIKANQELDASKPNRTRAMRRANLTNQTRVKLCAIGLDYTQALQAIEDARDVYFLGLNAIPF